MKRFFPALVWCGLALSLGACGLNDEGAFPGESHVKYCPEENKSGCPGMVLIPAGEFTMGTDDSGINQACRHQQALDYPCDRKWFDDEQPRRTVVLDAFYIDWHEVTVDEYRACVDAGRCTKPGDVSSNRACNWGSEREGSHPVNCVDWEQARKYCEWRGKRLPAEAEWEKAARGTDGRLYPWGEQPPSCDLVVWGDGRRTDGCGRNSTWPVCSKLQGNSPHGLCDTGGNVYEWVEDWYDPGYYASAPSRNPPGPPSGTMRVLRGGSWGLNHPYALRAGSRLSFDPAVRYVSVGIRCASPSP
ncbi:MAG: Serine/threonine-protein kinase pkn1 [Myxococcota bacterium]|nr:Serine/threonine-protein kinase pkn1 [Myxococcota bacterium]